jgi:nucleotide-binding universal stress UspA family protein
VRLRELALGLPASRIWPEVRVGTPVPRIVEVVQTYGADLLVVGPHGARPESVTDGELGREQPLGSTAARLARAASTPVLLARALPEGAPRRVLAAVDDSPRTDVVLAWARLFAARFGTAVLLLHVLDPGLAGATASPGTSGLMDALRDATRRWLDERAAPLRGAVGDGADVTTAVAVGEPAAEILAAASGAGADLVVIGTRRAEDAQRVLTGRTADRLLRRGMGPVLIVPEPA